MAFFGPFILYLIYKSLEMKTNVIILDLNIFLLCIDIYLHIYNSSPPASKNAFSMILLGVSSGVGLGVEGGVWPMGDTKSGREIDSIASCSSFCSLTYCFV